jgi:hypothetical protein
MSLQSIPLTPPRLAAVSLSSGWHQLWMRFRLDRPLSIDAAPLTLTMLVDGTGTDDRLQFALTVSRRQLRRYFVIDHGAGHVHDLDGEGFAMGERVIVVPFDEHWLASVRPPMSFGALLSHDASDTTERFPVSVLGELR